MIANLEQLTQHSKASIKQQLMAVNLIDDNAMWMLLIDVNISSIK